MVKFIKCFWIRNALRFQHYYFVIEKFETLNLVVRVYIPQVICQRRLSYQLIVQFSIFNLFWVYTPPTYTFKLFKSIEVFYRRIRRSMICIIMSVNLVYIKQKCKNLIKTFMFVHVHREKFLITSRIFGKTS